MEVPGSRLRGRSQSRGAAFHIIMTVRLTLTCMLLVLPVVLEASQVLVPSPSALASAYPQGIAHRMATFGQFPYGSYVYGKLAIVSQDGCSTISTSLQGKIYLIKRGGCLFTKKVLNAEQAGADAVIIYNNKTDNALLLMGARPAAITIPSVFISYESGMALIKALDVYLNLTFLVSPQKPASFAFAFSLSDYDSLLQQAIPIAKALRVDTRPVFAITVCEKCTSFQQKVPFCLAGGRFCAEYADEEGNYLREAIRQQCIYSLNHSAYLPYLEKWFSDCNRATHSLCLQGLSAAGVSEADVNTCFTNSFQSDIYIDANQVLYDLHGDFTKLEVQGTPTVTLWDETYYGELTDSALQRAICAYKLDALQVCTGLQCSTGCWNDMLGNGQCDVVCNTTLCQRDNGSCGVSMTGPSCSPGCTEAMRLSGRCYTDCNNELCGYGNGACLCAPGCTPDLRANRVCDPVCNTLNCTNDNGMCAECSFGCTGAMLQSEDCHEPCNNPACNFNNWNCRCAANCTNALLYNSHCDPACNTLNCNYDNGLCKECSPGCLGEMLLEGECYDVCDTESCNYSGGNCRCARECPLELMENDRCDEECNIESCSYDGGACGLEEGSDSNRAWVKPVIISLSLLGGL